MPALTWGTSIPKGWTEFKTVCDEDTTCTNGGTCVAQRWTYVEDGEDTEWNRGHGCDLEFECPGDDQAAVMNDESNEDGSEYWEGTCDLNYAETFSMSIRGASVATVTVLIAISAALF